ncbi:probable transcription factor At4g00390 [Phoenix dactylifera]|uniref:Probable transcription factor At4g00390 n=1 Tax=Phoenix dactylifera TaxID=42345 RepID=A0A8B8ZRD8_PHODC|nr:probable transcription factor At4g00390 [Phoenix dactylifera]
MTPKCPAPRFPPSVVSREDDERKEVKLCSDEGSHDEDDELPSPGAASSKRVQLLGEISSNGGDESSDDDRKSNDREHRRPPKISSKDNITVQPAPNLRFWPPDDEITILKGLIDHRSEVGNLPSPKQLQSRVCGSLKAMANCSQFSDKVWQLRRKFQANGKRGRSVDSFADPHERAVFDLSNQIWGDQNSTTANKKKEMTGNAVDAQDVCSREEVMKVRYPHLWEAVTRKANEVEYGGEAMMRKLKKLGDSKASMAQKILVDLDKAKIKITMSRASLLKDTFRLLDEGLNEKG